jgi:hypothetical protein
MASGQVLAGMVWRRDGGKAWRPRARGIPEECHVPRIILDPRDGSRIHAGTRQDPHLSIYGEHWQRLGFAGRSDGVAGRPDVDPNAGVSVADGVKEMAE